MFGNKDDEDFSFLRIVFFVKSGHTIKVIMYNNHLKIDYHSTTDL